MPRTIERACDNPERSADVSDDDNGSDTPSEAEDGSPLEGLSAVPRKGLSNSQRDSITFLRNATTNRGYDKRPRRLVLPKEITWNGDLETYQEFKDSLIGHYIQSGAGYLFDKDFQKQYLELGLDCHLNFPEELSNSYQLKKEIQSLYGALKSSCKKGIGSVVLLNHKDSQDGIKAWLEMEEKFDADGDRLNA